MTTRSVVRARIDGQIKEEASVVLEAIGLSVSDAFRMLLTRIAREKTLPFELLVPNAKTIRAIKAARKDKLVNVGKPEDLIAELNEKH